MKLLNIVRISIVMLLASACCSAPSGHEVVVLAPGHFHAALALKHDVAGVDSVIRVYAPQGPELESFLRTIESFNSRGENPTSWKLDVNVSEDFMSEVPQASRGAFVVLSGKNRTKAQTIYEAVRKGYNVLSDKPMAITPADYELLSKAYAEAERRGLVIYDLMTERYEVLNVISREIMSSPDIFGTPESVDIVDYHYFYKKVAGSVSLRPQWYYDVREQGEGIADVTTHFIDLAFWQCFPREDVVPEDITDLQASHYPTRISLDQYCASTGALDFPDYLQDCVNDGILDVYCNGVITCKVKGVPMRIDMRWDFESPDGTSGSFSSVNKGSGATLYIRQDAGTQFRRRLLVECPPETAERIGNLLSEKFPQVVMTPEDGLYRIEMSGAGHEDHFSKVVETFIAHLDGEKLPSWEKSNTLAKYYMTTSAVNKASEK